MAEGEAAIAGVAAGGGAPRRWGWSPTERHLAGPAALP